MAALIVDDPKTHSKRFQYEAEMKQKRFLRIRVCRPEGSQCKASLRHGVTAHELMRTSVTTVYYAELSKEMAMKIGDEYRSERVAPRAFDKLAEQAGLAKPLVRRRVPELAKVVSDAIGRVTLDHEVTRNVGTLIRKRCEATLKRFAG